MQHRWFDQRITEGWSLKAYAHSAFDFAPVLCSSKSQLEFRGGRGIKDSDQSIMEGRRRCFGAKVDTLISSFN
ncbi:hypothetical protein V6N13_098160 [Hibiscus sabdariffa]